MFRLRPLEKRPGDPVEFCVSCEGVADFIAIPSQGKGFWKHACEACLQEWEPESLKAFREGRS